jgi:CRP-like cAMP-binding protein
MSFVQVKKDTIIFKQGWIGNYFYIIKEGLVELSINDKSIKIL